MSDLTETTGNAAVLAAQKAAEEERAVMKRKAIQSQIDQWDARLTSVNSLVSALTEEQTKLNTYLGEWGAQKNRHRANEILSEVVIVNVFEGVCADRIKEEFLDCITKMDEICGRISRLSGYVSAQIVRLNQYISVINTKMKLLRNELRYI